MSAVVSEMLIRIAADTAQLRSQMEDAKSSVVSAFGGMDKAISLAKTGLIAFAGVASVTAFAKMIGSIVDGIGAMNDLAISTGVSVAALQQFKSIGALSETSIESITGATLKLSKAMSLMDEDGKGAALAIKALGIDFENFKRLSPEQQMLTVAQSMNKFEDGADKSAAAMMLFGREGAKLLPFLKDLGDSAGEVNAKLTEQNIAARAAAAAMADAYGDNLTKIRKNSDGWKKDLAEGMLPVMYEASQAFLEMTGGTGGLRDQLKQLVADGTIAKWGRAALEVLSYIIDAIQIAAKAFVSFGKVTADVFWGLASALKGDFSKAADYLRDIPKDIADQWGDKLLGQTFRDRMADLKGVGVQADGAKEKLNLSAVLKANEEARKREEAATKAQAEAEKAAIAEYQRAVKAGGDLVVTIDAKNAALAANLALGRDLTPVEKELLKLDQDLKTGKIILSAAIEEETRKKIALGETMESEIALREEIKKKQEQGLTTIFANVAAMDVQTAKVNEENYALRNGKDALDELQLSRLKDSQAIAQEVVAHDLLLGYCNKETYAHQETLRALNELIAAREDNVHLKAAKEAADEWQKTADTIGTSLTDALMRGFEAGKGFAANLRDALKNLFNTLILRPIIQPIAQGASNMVLSAFGLGGSGSSMDTLGSLGKIGSSLSNLVQGGSNFLSGATLNSAAAGGWTRAGDYAATSSNGTIGGIGDWMQANPQIGSMLGIAGNAFAGYGLGKFANSAISGQYSVGKGFNTVADIGAAVASAFMGPAGGAIVGAIAGLINRAFGMGDKNVTEQGISGSFGMGSASGQAYSQWHQDGGWFRSDKNGTDYTALNSDMASALTSGAASIYDSIKGYAAALKLPVDALQGVTTDFRIALTNDATANEKAITDALQSYQNALTSQYESVLMPFKRAGETLVETMQRLTIIEGVSQSLNNLGGAFGMFAHASVDARESIIGLAGGIDALMQKANGFVSNYYTANEQGGMTAKAVTDGLKGAGFTPEQIGALDSRADYRALLESIDISTTTGQQQFAALLNMQDSFASVSELLTSQGITLTDLAAQAPVVAALDSLFKPTQDTATATQNVADGISTSNNLLTSINANLEGIAASSAAAVSAAAAAVTAASSAASAASSAASSASLASSLPSYKYDMGATP